jgi:transcription-repair coupling factor (superfamily II helicase)
MIDRFGALPKEVESLLLVERLKIFAHSLYIMEVRITTQRIHLKFIKDAKINLEKLKALVENNIGHVRVLSSTEPEINYINYGDISIKESFDKCFDLLKELE